MEPPQSYVKHAAAHADLHGAFGADRFGAIAEKIARFFGTPQYTELTEQVAKLTREIDDLTHKIHQRVEASH
jgi:hypothetical protein